MTALLPVCALLVNALVWGVSWWPFRYLQAQGLHPLWATALIYAAVLAGLALLRPRAWRGFAAHPALWLLMLSSGLNNLGFNWAVATGDVVRVVLLFYLMPLWAALLAWPLLGERPHAAALARMGLALAGVAVVLRRPGAAWPVPEGLPDWLALMAGICFALTNILLLRLRRAPAEARVMAMFGGGMGMAALAAGLGLAQGTMGPPPLPHLAWVLPALALALAILAGNVALQYGAARLSAHATSLVMLAEIVFASVSSMALGAARPDARTWAGGALILGAALWSALAPARSAR
ncbi:DMT family transporter [Ramlibacter sp. H39-3-26]|uniref:DMT family transporter n=1 Tax=Curvibacter soli TaxID=3031331 RepID=UPI0023DC24A2|nr:DMT family transporter [Ramlibacter sp. H39-3-26]MDF1486058.1 DMT family transporter [Ramlibacter sp. H39-3-26]